MINFTTTCHGAAEVTDHRYAFKW